MDREKESEYVTHYQALKIQEQLRREFTDGDKEVIKMINNVDSRVDTIAVDVRGMKVTSENTLGKMSEMVELMKEQKQETKEFNKKNSENTKRMFDKIEKNSEDIIKISSDFKSFNEKRDKNWKWKSIIVGGTFSVIVGFFKLLQSLAPIMQHFLFGK